MIEYLTGDLLEAPVDAIAHGCNCEKKMNAGIALQIARKYPEAAQADAALKSSPEERLGTIAAVPVEGKHAYVINCYTQLTAAGPVDYHALRRCMEDLCAFCEEHHLSLGIPKIGSGLGGGDWHKIEAIIKDVFHDSKIAVYVKDR